MRKLVIASALAVSLVICGAGQLPAAEGTCRSTPVACIETVTVSITGSTPLLAQYSSDNGYSSSSSTRIPRGAIKLGIFLVIGLISLCAWVVRRVFS